MARSCLSLASALLLLGACEVRRPRPPIETDGRLDEAAWHWAVRTGPFVNAGGQPAAPYSDARFVVAPTSIYLALYAADEDIRTTDRFDVEIGERTLHFGPADAGPDVGIDMDGTLDNPDDLDEEWIIEARVPRTGLPRGDVPVHVRRCDTPKDGIEKCGEARTTLRLP
jgi:hypothetical protein